MDANRESESGHSDAEDPFLRDDIDSLEWLADKWHMMSDSATERAEIAQLIADLKSVRRLFEEVPGIQAVIWRAPKGTITLSR